MHQIISYIKFLIASSNQHGVHSPFVYDLVTKCFYDQTNYPEYKALKNYRSELLQNKHIVKITDFGSGSKVFSSNNRPINAIAKTSGSTLKNAKLLFRIARYFQPTSVLELGTNLGIATYALALGNPKTSIVTIEGCDELLKVATKTFATNQITNITAIQGDFKTEIPKLNAQHWDLVFFDGDHSQASTLAYFEMLLPRVHNNSVFIFDDIYWSKDMSSAWEIIKAHPRVTVTIDTFNWGFVFFRKEQGKEHFKIRV